MESPQYFEHDANDESSPDLEEMLRKAKELASFMRSGGQDIQQSFVHDEDESTSQSDAVLPKAANDAHLMKRDVVHLEEKKDSEDQFDSLQESADDPVDEMLLKAGKLAAQMRKPKESIWPIRSEQTTSTNSLTINTTDVDQWHHSSDCNDFTTPRAIVATVSLDEQDDEDVETMLLKADLLSRTIRSAANGQLNTPELLRASDEILKRAKRNDESIATETTPHLLARAQKILTHPESVARLGDMSVDTVAHSMETDPVRNGTQLPSLLNRPPRPPSTMRTPAATQAITPSPKAQQSKAPDTEDLMERVIATLQRFPTTKTPDSPVMPNSVALLKTLDSDDYSSVGSGSARSATRSLHGVDPAFGSPERNNSTTSLAMEEASAKSVEEAEDMAMQMAKALEETLIHSQSSSLQDDDDVTSPALRPRQLINASTTSPTINNKSSYSNSRALASAQVWDEHDAISPRKNNFMAWRSPSHEVEWETYSPIKPYDEDYAPIQDFRNSGSRSLGVGLMPEHDAGLVKKRSWKLKRNSLIRAFVVCIVLSVALVLTAKLIFSDNGAATTDSDPSATQPLVVSQRVENPQSDIPTFFEPQKEITLPLVPNKEKVKLQAVKPKVEIPAIQDLEIAPVVQIDDLEIAPAPVPQNLDDPISKSRKPSGRCFVPLGYIANVASDVSQIARHGVNAPSFHSLPRTTIQNTTF
ncbi:hypothetical protein MHU86_6803 [Fragilaria crotonensis]|nr:hypothetical protein MHU86_6803 [Fragilaria crotonensis]